MGMIYHTVMQRGNFSPVLCSCVVLFCVVWCCVVLCCCVVSCLGVGCCVVFCRVVLLSLTYRRIPGGYRSIFLVPGESKKYTRLLSHNTASIASIR